MSAATSLRPSEIGSENAGRRARKALLRDINRDLAQKAKAKLSNLRAELRKARAAHKAALKDASSWCRAQRLALSERLRTERAEVLAGLRTKGEAARHGARGVCALEKGRADTATRPAVDEAGAELAEERATQEGLKRIERGNRARAKEKPRSTAAERRSESDDEVRQNIAPELVGLWDRVKRSIKGGPRETRTEAFLRYVEEHPEDYLESIDDQTEALIRDLERRQRQARNPSPRKSAAPKSVGSARELLAADPRIPSVEIGELVAVVYRTAEGEHRHEFRHPRPRLAYNESGLLIAGGAYRLDARGIVEAPRPAARASRASRRSA